MDFLRENAESSYEIAFFNTFYEDSILVKNLYLSLFAEKYKLFIAEYASCLDSYNYEKDKAYYEAKVVIVKYATDEDLKEIMKHINEKALVLVIHDDLLDNDTIKNIYWVKDDISALGQILYKISTKLSSKPKLNQRKEQNYPESVNNKVLKEAWIEQKFSTAIDKSDRYRVDFFTANRVASFEELSIKKKIDYSKLELDLRKSDVSIAKKDFEKAKTLYLQFLDTPRYKDVEALYDILLPFADKTTANYLADELFEYASKNIRKSNIKIVLNLFYKSLKPFTQDMILEYQQKHFDFAQTLIDAKCFDAAMSVLINVKKSNQNMFEEKWLEIMCMFHATSNTNLVSKAKWPYQKNELVSPFKYGYDYEIMKSLVHCCILSAKAKDFRNSVAMFDLLLPYVPTDNNGDYVEFLLDYSRVLMEYKKYSIAEGYLMEALSFDFMNVSIYEDIILCMYHSKKIEMISTEKLQSNIMYFFINVIKHE